VAIILKEEYGIGDHEKIMMESTIVIQQINGKYKTSLSLA